MYWKKIEDYKLKLKEMGGYMKRLALLIFLVLVSVGCKQEVVNSDIGQERFVGSARKEAPVKTNYYYMSLSGDKEFMTESIQDFYTVPTGEEYVLKLVRKDDNTAYFNLVRVKKIK